MAMTPEAFAELQAAVGAEHVARDPSVLSGYSWNRGVGALPGDVFIKHWPVAVVMPSTTEEVAAVIKACGRHGLRFRAHSTGNGAVYLARSANVVVIDLRRMNRIVKIDRPNQMAIIEPYATAGRLQAEAMKVGLTCHIVGAGPSHSPLASATSFMGIGITGISTSWNPRNLLGMEWVSPEGEIVRIGSCGSGDGWFSEEGPGPGVRGLLRGFVGANGALGVFTRIGYKLHPWMGAGQPQLVGRHPQVGMKITDNMHFLVAGWRSFEDMTRASFELNRSGVIFGMLRMPPNHIGWVLTPLNHEYAQRTTQGTLPEYARTSNRISWQLLTVGRSAREAAYQQQVVREIVSSTDGFFYAVADADAEMMVRNLVTSLYVGRVSRGAATGGTSFGFHESFNLLPESMKVGEALLREHAKPGKVFASDAIEGFWSWPTEGRTFWSEDIIAAEPTKEGAAATMGAFLRHFVTLRRRRLGMPAFVAGPLNDLFGKQYSNAPDWMRRIKKRIDPHNRADNTMYVDPAPPAAAKAWPLLEKILMSRLARPLYRAAMLAVVKKGP